MDKLTMTGTEKNPLSRTSCGWAHQIVVLRSWFFFLELLFRCDSFCPFLLLFTVMPHRRVKRSAREKGTLPIKWWNVCHVGGQTFHSDLVKKGNQNLNGWPINCSINLLAPQRGIFQIYDTRLKRAHWSGIKKTLTFSFWKIEAILMAYRQFNLLINFIGLTNVTTQTWVCSFCCFFCLSGETSVR